MKFPALLSKSEMKLIQAYRQNPSLMHCGFCKEAFEPFFWEHKNCVEYPRQRTSFVRHLNELVNDSQAVNIESGLKQI